VAPTFEVGTTGSEPPALEVRVVQEIDERGLRDGEIALLDRPLELLTYSSGEGRIQRTIPRRRRTIEEGQSRNHGWLG